MLHSIKLLHDVYSQRRIRNGSYSLRAYARDLTIPASSLVSIMQGKRPLTLKTAEIVAERLKLGSRERKKFLGLVHLNGSHHGKESGRQKLVKELLNYVKGWENLAILSLCQTRDFSSEHDWIASRLGISVTECRNAIDRLEKLGLIRCSAAGIERTCQPLTTTWGIPSKAIQFAHGQHLEQAGLALRRVPVDRRIFSSITFPTDPKKLKEASVMIKEFGRKLSAFLEDGDKTQVYRLGVQLIPLTKDRGTKDETEH